MTFDLEYNSERPHLIIPEYGRHIQKLVDHCKELPTKDERNTMAQAIVDVMGNLQPHLRDVQDFKHKIWDQLFIMSSFQLDVDSPYPKPTEEEIMEKPEPLAYPEATSKYRYYGNNIQKMIKIANDWEEGDLKEALIYNIANHMKKCYLNWNKDTVDDTAIFNHLYELSHGKIDLRGTEEELVESKTLLKKRNGQGQNNAKNKKHTKNRKR